MQIFITYIPIVKFLWVLQGFLECMGTHLHLLSTLENMIVVMSLVKSLECRDKVSQKLLCCLSVLQGKILYLFFLHPCLSTTCSLGEILTFCCWRPANPSLSFWLSGRGAVNKGSDFCSSSGCAGEHYIALSILGMARQIWRMPPCCGGARCWRAGAVWWGWLLTGWVWILELPVVGGLEIPGHKSNKHNWCKKKKKKKVALKLSALCFAFPVKAYSFAMFLKW